MSRKARIGSPAWSGHVGMNKVMMEHAQPTLWPSVDEDALSEERRDIFVRRKRAVLDYFAGASAKEIKHKWGFTRSHIYRLINERCLETSSDGTLFGWRGLIPHMRIKKWIRQSEPAFVVETGGGISGSLQWLFSSPENKGLEQEFRKQILSLPVGLEGTRRPKLALLRWFYDRLREKGIERRREWPFNTERLGYTTLCKFINKVLDENPKKQRILLGGAEAERKSRAGDGVNRPKLNLFQRVECDAHKLDIRMVVMVPSPHVGYEPRKIHRLWVIVILEVVTRVVLGYYISMRREVAAEDVLRAVRNALGKWSRRSISFSDNAYSNDANFPSGLDPAFVGACWDEFSVDGAMANVCDRVEKKLKEVVDCIVIKPQDSTSFSSRRSLDDRPFIETFFRVLGRGGGGLHALSTSTKSSPAELKGDANPAEKAHELHFQMEYLSELLDVIIANYNTTPHHGIGYRTPLAQLKFLSEKNDGFSIRTADPIQVARLGATRKLCTLLGGVKTGRRPYFNFENARYSSSTLVQKTSLIGNKFWLTIENEDDARWATVSTQEGILVCVVRAAPPWHSTPHSLYVRRSIRALEVKRLIHLTGSADAPTELIKFSENQRDKKLPVHPAYLELRRILQAHADNFSENPMANPLSMGRQTEILPNGQDAPIKINTNNIDEFSGGDIYSNKQKSEPRTFLPAMRKAKTW